MKRAKRILNGLYSFLIGMIAWAAVPFLIIFDIILFPIMKRKNKKK